MQQNDTLNLLISCESQAQLEAYLGIFRDAGHTTRAHRVSSLRNLGELVRDPQWDGLIATDRHPELSVAEALNLLAERGSDLPCVVRLAEVRADLVLDCLKRGAREVMGIDENTRLVHSTLRELRALREHRELLALRVQYAETARRAELLLAASQDAIAYVVDGMHVHANELYAGMFGYASVEELAGVGIVDLIAASKQKAFKEALREYRSHPEEQTAIEFTGLRADGAEFGGQLVLSTASYEGEPCMQVLVRAASPAAASAAAASEAPPPTPANAPAGGLAGLRAALAAASSPGQLMLVGIDGYAQHCRKLGASAAARLVAELASFVAEANAWKEPVLHVADAVFARILPRVDAEGAADSARLAVESVAGHIHTVGSQSLTCSISVAICPLDTTTGVDALIDRAWQGLLDAGDRGASLRAADPARVEVLREPQATPARAAAASGDSPGEAVRQQQFRLLYQPIVSLRGDTSEYYQVQVIHAPSGKDAGAWLAESANAEASLDLDKWTVIESLKQLATHRRTHPGTRLILPVGAGAVLETDFANWLGLALRAAELPVDCVVLQVSHHAVSSSLRQAKQLAERLQVMGCALAVCDVHSANNPVADLAHLKPQFARIDAVLAQSLKDTEATNTLLKPLIESLHQEQIASIMPNVDSASVLAVLWQLGVNYIQGDYLQKPMPAMSYDFTDMA